MRKRDVHGGGDIDVRLCRKVKVIALSRTAGGKVNGFESVNMLRCGDGVLASMTIESKLYVCRRENYKMEVVQLDNKGKVGDLELTGVPDLFQLVLV